MGSTTGRSVAVTKASTGCGRIEAQRKASFLGHQAMAELS